MNENKKYFITGIIIGFCITAIIFTGVFFGLRSDDNTRAITELEKQLETSINRGNIIEQQLNVIRAENAELGKALCELTENNNKLQSENSELGQLIRKSIIGGGKITERIRTSITELESIENKFEEAKNKDFR